MRPYLESKSRPIYKHTHDHSYDFPSHFHKNLELAFCFCGTQKIKVRDRVYVLGAGDAILIFPNLAHEYLKSENDNTKSLSLICNTRLLTEVFPDIVTKCPEDPLVPAAQISKNAVLAFEGLACANDQAQMLGWTYIALADLLSTRTLVSCDGDKDLPARVVAYVDENFKDPLTIEHLSKIFGYHPSYIAHIFCDQLKITFRTYLGAVRAEYAADEIRTTQKSLTEIAYETGCNSLNTFCRCFKKHFSMTPSQYKKSVNRNASTK